MKVSPTMKTVKSGDGIEYRVLSTPAVVKLESVGYCGKTDCGDGYKFHHVFMRANTFDLKEPRSMMRAGLPLSTS